MKWTSGLCHCCEDMSSCCFAFWCFPCFACKTSKDFGESLCLPLVDICGPALMATTGIGICVPPVALSMRVAIRHKHQIPGGLCEDILISCFCVWCSWCQMHREIKHRKRAEATMVQSQPLAISTVTTTSAAVPIVTYRV